MESLPIDALRPELENAWRTHRNFILRAPTGSGKSTRVPRYLYDWEGFDKEQQIIILQPRRMAARLLSKRVAEESGQSLGELVGYQVRFEKARSARTRILYLTEGMLVRKLLGRDNLDQVGAILFDEFHERHIEGDIALGLALEQQNRGWSGRIGVFSATLEVSGLASYLPDVAILESDGRSHPVEINWVPSSSKDPWDAAAAGIRTALRDGAESDILAFMPGKYEIMRTVELLERLRELSGWEVYPLHGDLPPEAQDRAVGTGSRPRVIVSTNIAETSLTLPGIRTVIDCGLARVPDYDPERGINTLLTERISRSSAEQRAGRAGRVAPGRCYRLWNKAQHERLPEFTAPEIERLELAETRLQVASRASGEAFPWLEAPPEKAWNRAGELLEDLGATQAGLITSTGREMVSLPLHPRHARMLLEARKRQCSQIVMAAIALLEVRDLVLPLSDKRMATERESWWTEAEGFSDLLKGVLIWNRVMRERDPGNFCRKWGIHAVSLFKAQRIFSQLRGLLEATEQESMMSKEAFACCVLAGYVDCLALRVDRGSLRCRLGNARRGELTRRSLVHDAPLLVASGLQEREYRGEVTVFLDQVTAVDPEWLKAMYPGELRTEHAVVMDMEWRRVEAVERTCFRSLVLAEKETGEPDVSQAAMVLADSIQKENWVLKKWDHEAETWIRRLAVLARNYPEYEISPIGEEDRRLIIEQVCEGAVSYKQVKDRAVLPIIQSWLADNLHGFLEKEVPTRFTFPDGKSAKLRFESDGTVVLPARIQQLYDVPGTALKICSGRQALRLEILAPNNRPVQITDDLDGFWTGQYPQIKKDLFGRYPKHEWR
jgi:ATP-dependent helicase HrpB